MSIDLPKLQALRLKGRASAEMLAPGFQQSEDETRRTLAVLRDAGLVEEKKGWFGLTAAGEAQRRAALATEREQLDERAVATLYAEFCAQNGDFKQLVTDVQLGALSEESAPGELARLHVRFSPLVGRIGAAIPRLAAYAVRFERALEKLGAGDARYLASPLVESYHTLWFELHEELIQATGRSRQDEAAAGRGA